MESASAADVDRACKAAYRAFKVYSIAISSSIKFHLHKKNFNIKVKEINFCNSQPKVTISIESVFQVLSNLQLVVN